MRPTLIYIHGGALIGGLAAACQQHVRVIAALLTPKKSFERGERAVGKMVCAFLAAAHTIKLPQETNP